MFDDALEAPAGRPERHRSDVPLTEQRLLPELSFRTEVFREDAAAVRELADQAGVFSPEEVDLAAELASERAARGLASGYHFVIAEKDGRMVGYTCFGPIPCTRFSHDLYWIVVAKKFNGQGLGRRLLEMTEEAIAGQGGRRIYVDTSSRPPYEPARRFYRANGYALEALVRCFYAPDDHKMLYLKTLPGSDFLGPAGE